MLSSEPTKGERDATASPLGRIVVGWVSAAVAVVVVGVALALWGLGLYGRLSTSTDNVLDIVKLAFAFVAGIGGTLGLVLAYRRHQIAERAAVMEHAKDAREETKAFNERFRDAAEMLGSDLYAVKLAGVYAMAGLADDWHAGRQTCIDVLCATLRQGHPGRPDPDRPPAEHQTWRDDREFRLTVVQALTARLRGAEPLWQGVHFNFIGVVFEAANFSSMNFRGGTAHFNGATFSGGNVDFHGTRFSGGQVEFEGAQFRSGRVDFSGTVFSGGTIDFSDSTFSGATVDFAGATFSGSAVAFDQASFTSGKADFSGVADWSMPPRFSFPMDSPPPGVLLPAPQ